MDECVDKLKCTICNNHLSYFPIYLSLDKKNICGRCESTTKDSPVYIRNDVYEILARRIEFPCRYHKEGCQKQLIPSEIPSHEKSCTYRLRLCPTESITGCVEEFRNPDLIEHCQEKHSDLILKDYKFEIDLSHSYQIKNLLLHEDTLFIVTKIFCLEDNTFQCLINNLENQINSKIDSYQIIISSNDTKISINCVVNACKNKKICLDMLKNCDDDDGFLVSCEIVIGNTNNKSNSSITNYKNIHDRLLVKFKCLNCFEYLIPPFYTYECNGNITCSHCKMVNVFELNEIANFLNYPCIYQKNGCDFICTPPRMRNHKIFCSFANCECPVNEYTNCTWKGLSKEVMEHVKKDHHQMTVHSPKSFDFYKRSSGCYIMKYSNRLFRLVITKNNNKYIWSVQLIGPFAEKYKYEIEIVKNDKSGKLQLVQPCPPQPLIKRNQIGQDKNVYSYIYDDQIQNFIYCSYFKRHPYFNFTVKILP